ncbi:PcfJ domain-containing protein [Enterococcus faecalis]|uniref:PcfJ domain-containing protein n=1 Tax=Enterococcus faecalis TaxID=1351 RepID=UPI000F810EB0|nr:PcfJ domain-containing protein [Enterococcus faecalis]EKZ0201582.1 PcfJ domain-containing protein [Enterococcus faecalis]MCC4085293.1 PcfJ domain-containing protein [Enterococcus faecalis]MCL8369739.1 PcfJ domain-containing protein [Enterococcus faecalis]MDG4630530.1 PcfJ domain-containing protein [Enterococcus faecalis]MDG4633881.1 PcfJ domain-containing protein [Enterococcus faecalis]
MTPEKYVENKLQPPKAFFEWCYVGFRTYKWKNKEREIVASDRKHSYVIEKRLTKNSRLTFYDKSQYFQIVLATSKRIEVQTYKICSLFTNGIQHYEKELVNLEIFQQNQHIKIGNFHGGYRFGKVSVLQPLQSYYFHGPELYPNKWRERLEKVSELKYLDLEDLTLESLDIVYKYRTIIEFLQKIGAKKLAKSIILKDEDMRLITKKRLMKHKQLLKNSDNGVREMLLIEAFERQKIPMVKGIDKYVTKDNLKEFPEEISVIKFQNWLIKQKKPFHYYKDYLSMMRKLGIPITKHTILPKALEEEHDKLVALINEIKYAEETKEIMQRAKEKKHYETVIDEFCFILPKTANDIIYEGKALAHCVATYIDDHAHDKTTIVFVRKKECPQKAYFTLEYRNKEIRQIQGYENKQKAPEDLKKSVDKWVKTIKN